LGKVKKQKKKKKKHEVILSPINLIPAVKDKIMERSGRVLSRDIVSKANLINPEIIKKEEEGVCPTLETLKQQYIESVHKEVEEDMKEGYVYSEEKVQEEIEEFMIEVDLDDKIHKEMEQKVEQKVEQKKNEPKEVDTKLQLFPREGEEWKD
jgi:rubrerythrin